MKYHSISYVLSLNTEVHDDTQTTEKKNNRCQNKYASAPGLIPFREFTWLKQSAETMLQELRDEHDLNKKRRFKSNEGF